MRHIGNLPDAGQAQTFVDYLLVRGIQSKADQESDGWAIWILDEDSVPSGQQELQQFRANPADPRYSEAASHAAELRQDTQRRAAEARKKIVNVRDRWSRPVTSQIRLTFLLAACCVGATFASNFGDFERPATRWMLFSWQPEPGDIGLIRFLTESPFARIRQGEVWRLVTPIFLHGSALHLFGNTYWLIVLGGMIEYRRDLPALLGLVIGFALISDVSQALWRGPMFLGFSGVNYGLFGYIWMRSRFVPESGLYISPNNVMLMLLWFVLCLTGAVGPIANAAHWSGLVAGMVVGYAPKFWQDVR